MVLNSRLHFKINFESVKKLCWHFAFFSNRMLRQKEMMVGDCQLATVISKTASWYLFLVTVIRLVQVYLNVSEGLHRLCWAPNVGITSTEPSSHSPTPPSLEKPCQPDQNFIFPETYFGKQKCSFQWHWYPWLHYDITKDRVTCYICKQENKKSKLFAEQHKEDVFRESSRKKWKKATNLTKMRTKLS